MDPAELYALACLAGGPGRAVDTAVVTLLADGRLQVTETGELFTAVLRYGHPVEAAVLDAVGRRARRSVETVRHRCGEDQRLAGLVEQQASAGLLRRRRLPGRDRWTTTDAGRQRLAGARVRTDGGPPLRLALDGLDALPDQRLRIRVFDPPRSPRRVGGGHLSPGMATDRIGENGWAHGADAGDHGPRW